MVRLPFEWLNNSRPAIHELGRSKEPKKNERQEEPKHDVFVEARTRTKVEDEKSLSCATDKYLFAHSFCESSNMYCKKIRGEF